MNKYYVLFFLMVISIPVFLWINVSQANRCGEIRREIRRIENLQENLVENNRLIAAEIADQLAIDRLELDARGRLGLRKMRPEDIRLIIMGGRERGL